MRFLIALTLGLIAVCDRGDEDEGERDDEPHSTCGARYRATT